MLICEGTQTGYPPTRAPTHPPTFHQPTSTWQVLIYGWGPNMIHARATTHPPTNQPRPTRIRTRQVLICEWDTNNSLDKSKPLKQYGLPKEGHTIFFYDNSWFSAVSLPLLCLIRRILISCRPVRPAPTSVSLHTPVHDTGTAPGGETGTDPGLETGAETGTEVGAADRPWGVWSVRSLAKP